MTVDDVRLGQRVALDIWGLGWLQCDILSRDKHSVTVSYRHKGKPMTTSYKRSFIKGVRLVGNSKNWRQFRD